ncbi:MAG: hypothetical protein ACAH59_03910 [Pseudobdellovibrionaceae bacterium]
MKLNQMFIFAILAVVGPISPSSVLADEEVIPEQRKQLLKNAVVWQQPVEEKTGKTMDLFGGPETTKKLQFGQKIECDFVFDVFDGGYSPKFKCQLGDKKVKIKYYNGNNRELFSEVIAGRLFWALGFGTDQNYMAEVHCRNCPHDDPFRWVDPRTKESNSGIFKRDLEDGLKAEDLKAKYINTENFQGTRVFPFAVVEAKFEGKEVGLWGWDEISKNSNRKHVDALKLLVALLQHADNADKQNLLVCKKENLIKAGDGTVIGCKQAHAYVQDLGGTFGGGGPKISVGGAANYNEWQSIPVWNDRGQCEIYLIPAGTPSSSQLRTSKISKAGRDFLLSRLEPLAQKPGAFEAMFKAAGMDHGGNHPDNRSAAEWAFLLRAKILDLKDACDGSSNL